MPLAIPCQLAPGTQALQSFVSPAFPGSTASAVQSQEQHVRAGLVTTAFMFAQHWQQLWHR